MKSTLSIGHGIHTVWNARNEKYFVESIQSLMNEFINFTKFFQFLKCAASETVWKLLSHFFDKTFVNSTFLLKKLLKSWFHEKIVMRSELEYSVELKLLHPKIPWNQLDSMQIKNDLTKYCTYAYIHIYESYTLCHIGSYCHDPYL